MSTHKAKCSKYVRLKQEAPHKEKTEMDLPEYIYVFETAVTQTFSYEEQSILRQESFLFLFD